MAYSHFNRKLIVCGRLSVEWYCMFAFTVQVRAMASSTALVTLTQVSSCVCRSVVDADFNEPGYESQMGTPEGDQQNAAYNAVIKEATVRCVLQSICA